MSLLYHPRKQLQRGMVIGMLLASFAAWGVPAFANEQPVQWTVRLDAATLTKGYTVRLPEDRLILVVPGKTVDQPITLSVEEVTLPPAVPPDLIPVSPVWKIVVTPQLSTTTFSITKPLRLVIAMQTQTLYQKQVRAWNDAEQRWKKVADVQQRADSAFDVPLSSPNTIIAVFDNSKVVEGKASWFRHRYADAAASNDFPVGSTLRVTDAETNHSVTVTVRSRGPFVPGRVIDISKQAFRQLRPLASGIANILVEFVRG